MSNHCTHESGCTLPIQNKKYGLCGNHMYEKKNGRSRQEVYAERAAAKPKKIYILKAPTKRIKQVTAKQSNINSLLHEIKTQIELEAIHNNEYYCKGCGKSHPGLDKSHILAIGQYKEFDLVKINIQLMCRDCHMKWESKRVVMLLKLDCYWNNLKIIQQLSEEAFEKYLSNLDEYINWLPDGSDKDALIARRLAL